MAEAVVSIALETLANLLVEEAKFVSGVRSQVKGLESELKEMKCLLEDADKRQQESKTVCNWITEIKDLAHRAEDVIEAYAVVNASYSRRSGHLLRRFCCVLESFSIHSIGSVRSEIAKIKSEIARVKQSMQEYGIRSIIQGQIAQNVQQLRRQTYPFEIEDCFVGKEDDLKQLVSLIVDKTKHKVISIWGMGGMGKTTIARKVYNHVETKYSYECFAWVCITQQCHIRSVMEEVLKQLIPGQKHEDISNMGDTEMIGHLRHLQNTKKCLIVLDDLWEIDHWDSLKHAFLVEGLNSKILMTTRKQNVAESGFAFEMGLLNINDGFELLKKKALLHSNIQDFAEEDKLLERLGKEMVHKLGYLPLAISLLGGILSKRKSLKEWELVNRNINRYLYKGEGIEKENDIHGVLNLSYDDLPYYLKPCFLYMGQFREDENINVRTIYRLWIAEGMISHENHGKDEPLMDIAEQYISELASRCIVQVQVEDVVQGEKYRTFRLHDVVRELCLSKGRKEDFGLQIMNYRGGKFGTLLNSSLLGSKTRHLAIHSEGELKLEQDGYTNTWEDTGKYVRSLQFLNLENEEKIEFPENMLGFRKFKLLRALLIQNCKFKGGKLPKRIGNLIHLKYLGLFSCALDKLPSSISNLTNLYSLDLGLTRNVRMPTNVLRNMHRLKHLMLPSYSTTEAIGKYRLRLDALDELETLHGFNTLMHDLKSLTRMKKLRRLSAVVHDNESLLAIMDSIVIDWGNLRYCKLSIKHDCQLTSMILKQVLACPDVHDLRIHVHIVKLLEEYSGAQIAMSRLKSLYFFECEIENDPMEILGTLPFLEVLRLYKRSFLGEEMRCHELAFPRLKALVLESLPNLREWRVEQGAMPVLSRIEINKCSRLEMVPNGLRFIVTLQELKISGMIEFGKRVFETNDGREGEDFDKVRHVPCITIVG